MTALLPGAAHPAAGRGEDGHGAGPGRPIRIGLVWDNFGPLHEDRLAAVTRHFAGIADVVGIEINGRSETYSWRASDVVPGRKITLFPGLTLQQTPPLRLTWQALRSIRREQLTHVFLCHYERVGIAALAYALRLTGVKVFTMGCSKFDDRSRSALRESAKQLFVAPYQGALVGSSETARFLRFLGLSGRPVALGYNSVSTERFVRFAGTGTVPFAERDFIVVARLVPKKNIAVVLRAYAGFIAAEPGSSRRLRLCGDGPLDGELRALAGTLGIADRVLFEGFLQSEEIAPRVAAAAALILVSTEEQFGNVVPEALAVGTPLILSDICGARYELLRTGVNGFVVEPDNVDGLTALMRLIVADEARWTAMSVAARALAPLGDTARFAEGVADLVGVAAG